MGLRTGLVVIGTLVLLPAPAHAAGSDTTTPILRSYAVADRTLAPGETISIDYSFTDNASTALSLVDFQFVDPAGEEWSVFALNAPLSGTLRQVVPGDRPAGTYTLDSVYGADASLNMVRYLRNRHTEITPVGATGPSSHSFDLAGSDLTIEPSAPGAPGGVRALAGDRSATVSWSAAPAHGSPVTEYVVTVAPGDRTISLAGDATSVSVDGLRNGTPYTFTVRATNALGSSPDSQPSRPVTPATTPSRVPMPNVRIRRQRVVVRWQAPPSNGSPLTGYRVILSGETMLLPASRRTLHQRLRPGRYKLRVLAVNGVGRGEASPVVRFRVHRGHWANG